MHQQIDFLAQWLSCLQGPLHSRISELWAELPAKVRHWLLEDGDGLAASAWHNDKYVKGTSCEPIQGAGEESRIGYDSPSDDDADPETEFCADNSENEDGHDDPSDPTTSTHDPVTGAVVEPTTWPTGLKTTGPGDQCGCEGLREFWFEIKQELGLSAWVSQIVGSSWPESSDFLSKAHELMADFCPSKNVSSDNSPWADQVVGIDRGTPRSPLPTKSSTREGSGSGGRAVTTRTRAVCQVLIAGQ